MDQVPRWTLTLYERPVLVIDPAVHIAPIWSATINSKGRWAVSASEDKTVRIWSLTDGTLLRTIRLPAGPDVAGRAYGVAMSPDGTLIAAGGSTGGSDGQRQIYLIDRESGEFHRGIGGVPAAVSGLTFSPDGNLLVATLHRDGIRIYSRDRDWAEVARDAHCDDYTYGAAFAPDGRLATTCFDGFVRIYNGDLRRRRLRPTAKFASSGRSPYDLAFSPDGTRLAIGYLHSAYLDVFDGVTLAPVLRPDLGQPNEGTLARVRLVSGRPDVVCGRFGA